VAKIIREPQGRYSGNTGNGQPCDLSVSLLRKLARPLSEFQTETLPKFEGESLSTAERLLGRVDSRNKEFLSVPHSLTPEAILGGSIYLYKLP
jgi:hypothetical protein